jgi:DNA-binding CsgD family transcriptional regulator
MVVSDAITLLQAGIVDRTSWDTGLNALADTLRAHHLIAVTDSPSDVTRTGALIWGAYLTHEQLHAFATAGEELKSLTASMDVGRAYASEAVVADDVMYSSQLYRQAVRPAGGHHAMAARPTGSALIAACRSRKAGPFSPPEVKTMQAVLPALEATIRLKSRLRYLEDRSSMLEKTLDDVEDLGIFLLDRDGFVVHLNRIAERMLRAKDGLYWKNGELSGARNADTARLRQAIGEASGQICPLFRPSSRKPLLLRAVSFDPRTTDHMQEAGHARIMLFVRDPDSHAAHSFDHVATALGLTRQEARLAALLADGRSVAEAANEIGITLGNARIHLKHIFSKTDTHRQAELVRLMLQAKP